MFDYFTSVLKSYTVVNEMAFLNENFGINAFLFRDQLFTADRQRVEAICAALIAREKSSQG